MPPQVQEGDFNNEWVFELQRLLIESDPKYYMGGHDSDFGPLTAEAVRDYQGDRGLKVDGICGPKTWAELGYPEQDPGTIEMAPEYIEGDPNAVDPDAP